MNHFGSLPLRKNRGKPLQRSISDASSKKTKRNSILNLFNTSNNNSNSSSASGKKINDSGSTGSGHRRVERSKSDAGRRRRGSNDSNSSTGSKTKRERFKFRQSKTNPNTNLLINNNSSDSDNNFLSVATPKKVQLSPITETHNRSYYFDEPDDNTKKKVKEKSSKLYDSGNIGFTSQEDLDLIPTTESRKMKQATFAKSKSVDDNIMHSSQMPPEKPTLTKGVAVDNMIKRLSIERVSPPPQVLTLGGFSYLASSPPNASVLLTQTKHKSLSPLTTTNTNPLDTGNDTANDIVYAQVVRNETKHANGNKTIYKETIHNTIKKNRSTSPPNTKASTTHNNYDTVDFVTATNKENSYSKYKNKSKHIINDIDEGLGNEVKIKYNNDYHFGNGHDDHHQHLNDEPIIKPNIRNRAPNKYNTTTTTTTTHITNYNDHNNFDVRDMDVNDLSYRREILESRIRSRIDGLHRGNPEPTRYRQRTVSPPAVSGRYHRYGSNEIINRYSPERTHHDIVTPIADEINYIDQKPIKYRKDYVDSTLRRNSHYYSKNEKVDSGIENDFRRSSYEKPRRNSRFDIG